MMNYRNYHTLTINGIRLSGEEIIQYCQSSEEVFMQQIGIFVKEWLGESPLVEVRTSGSTGIPKLIWVEKVKMLESANMTARYFRFQEGDTALLALPVSYIAGKMMVIRAFYSGLHLVCIPPSGNPIAGIDETENIDFAPFTPMQLEAVTDAPQIRRILLGGAPLDPMLEQKLQSFTSEVYHGFGMTETLSHIALRKVNGVGKSESYRALEGVTFDTDENNCLIIDAPFLEEEIITRDVVELLSDTSFIWKGRIDYVINSGGIKIFPEELEKALSFLTRRFFFAGMPDERFGERVCLFIEGEAYSDERMIVLHDQLNRALDKYSRPRDIYFIPSFQETGSGKINRMANREIVLSNLRR